jgi:predicted AAA+ superfamily ATPase
MPHFRHRYATQVLSDILSHSPIAGVIGQRQTGKTTLSEILSKEYETLDKREALSQARNDPKSFLSSRKHPFTIDECQLSPELFPALKEEVRLHPKKGQFILTGSVRFTSRKAIRESLTGRIVNLELLPLSIAEAHSEPLPCFLNKMITRSVFPELEHVSSAWLEKTRTRFESFLVSGGLPGICFYREAHVRTPRFEAQIETLLERDLRLLVNTPVSYRQLRELLAELARYQGQPLNYLALGRKIGVTSPTARKLISAFEAMFLIRSIATDQQSHPVIFFEDQGMATHLAADAAEIGGPSYDLARGLYSCVLPQFIYRPEANATFYQFRTRGGAKVDFAIRLGAHRIGVIAGSEDRPTRSELMSARSFVANAPNAKVMIAHFGNEIERVTDQILSLPYPLLVLDR